MIFSDVLVHVVAELNILGKYNLLCVYLVVQNLSQRHANMCVWFVCLVCLWFVRHYMLIQKNVLSK